MKRFFGLFILAVVAMSAPSAKAWGCADGESRVDVGKHQPSGIAGDGPNQWFLGTGSEGTKGDYYVCPDPNPPTKTKPASTLNQTQSQNQNQSQSQSSTSKATGGSVNNSGNSSNKNTNTASSAVTNSGNSESQSSAANNGNNANNSSYQSSSTYNEVKQNPGAFAPEIFSANPCAGVGISGGFSNAAVGISGGLQKIDKGCDDRATAILFLQAGNEIAYAKVMCITPAARRAHLTLDECRQVVRKQTTVIVAPPPSASVAPNVNVTVVIPPVVASAPEPTPVIVTTATQRKDFPNCSVPNASILTNVCKAELRDAARAMVGNPGAVLHIAAPQSVVSALKKFLAANGVLHGVEWGIFDGQNNNLSLYLTWTEEVR